MILVKVVFGLRKTLNDRSAEEETFGMRLRMMADFLKF